MTASTVSDADLGLEYTLHVLRRAAADLGAGSSPIRSSSLWRGTRLLNELLKDLRMGADAAEPRASLTGVCNTRAGFAHDSASHRRGRSVDDTAYTK